MKDGRGQTVSNRIPVFGVSVYPEKTSLKELDAYFKKVSECGFSKVFTSMFSIGDIVIVNDAMRHYKAELQIVTKPMANDGTRNWIGRIHDSEQFLLPYLDASYQWVLYE